MKMKNEVIIARLKKSGRYKQSFSETVICDNDYQALGYYDHISFLPVNSAIDLASLCAEGNDVYTESVVLIPVSSAEISLNQTPMMGIMSFILTGNEDREINLELARRIESLHENRNAYLKAYLTTGASSIAVIYCCEKIDKAASELNLYFQQMQDFCVTEGGCVYCFSIPFVNLKGIDQYILKKQRHDSMSKVHSSQVMLNEPDTDRLRAVTISFARKLGDGTGCTFQSWIDSVRNHFIKDQGCEVSVMGSISGTDDYLMVIEKVDICTLLSLFSSNGLLHKDVSEQYDSTCTTFLFDLDIANLSVNSSKPYQKGYKKVFESKENKSVELNRISASMKTDVQTNAWFDLLQDMIIGTNLEKYDHYLRAFKALENSHYTAWVYQVYRPMVEHFSELLICELRTNEEAWTVLRDTQSFFSNLYNMLESLLNTSVYFTDSPGFRKVENNIVPRLILSYQRIVNSCAEVWDRKADQNQSIIQPRKHLFLLAPHVGQDVYATMLFGELPPDYRMIILSLPISYALRPTIALPLLLHEEGHYIGVRDRKDEEYGHKGRDNFFVDIASSFFCCCIMEEFVKIVYGEQVPSDRRKLITAKEEDCRQSPFFSTLVFVLMEFQKMFKHQVLNWYREAKKHEMIRIDDEIEQLRVNKDDDRIAVLERKKMALIKGYFAELTPIMKAVFLELMEDVDENLIEGFSACCEQQIDAHPEDRDIYISRKKMQHFFATSIKSIIKTIAMSLQNSQEDNFVEKTQNILGEVAADVFMVRSLDMNGDEYLLLFFELFKSYSKKNEINKEYIDFRQFSDNKIRMLVMYDVITQNEKQLSNTKDIVKNRIESINRMRRLSDMEEQKYVINDINVYSELKNNIEEELIKYRSSMHYGNDSVPVSWKQDILRNMIPFYKIAEYTQQIYHDIRYVKKPDYIKKVKEIYVIAMEEEMGMYSACDLLNTLL